MIPRRRWCTAVLVVLATLPLPAGESVAHVIACRDDSGCVESVDAVAEAEFVWLWWRDAPPARVLPAEVKALLARGPASGALGTIQVQRRGDAAVKIIAAPVRMWEEVPEPLLPRFDVPKSGIVRIPQAQGAPWRARIIAREAGSWWTSLENGATSIVLVPATARRVRVTDEHGSPLAAAGITISAIRAGGSRSIAAQYRTDAHGWFTLEGLPDREPLTLIVSEKDHAPAAATARMPEIPETIVLRRGVGVAARFVDSRDEPIAGVRVRAEAWLGSSGAVVTRETASVADGSWKIGRLPADARAVLVASREGFAPLRREIVVEKNTDLGAIVLEEGIALPVRVVDSADRRPIEGARVRMKYDREQKTDPKGVARLSDVPATAAIELSATADGYLPETLQFSPPFDALVEVELTRAFVVQGRFEDTAAQPIPGAAARVVEGDSFRDVPLDGSAFRISLPPDRPLSIELSSPASRVVRIDVEGSSGETRDVGVIHPDQGIPIRGRVVTADGAPVAAASVWIPRTSAAGPVLEWATGNVVRAQTDADGAFALRGAGPEPVLLRVDATGFARTFRSLSFDRDARELDAGDIVVERGTIVAITGRAVWTDAVARITLRPETGDVDTLTAPLHDGAATIRNVPEGRAVVSVVRGHSTVCRKDVTVPERHEPFTVDCSAGTVRVRGRVFIGERPVEGGTLVWTSPSAESAAGVILNDTSRLGAVYQRPFGATSDVVTNIAANGETESDELWPGTWRVLYISPAGGTSEPREILIADRPDVTVVLRYEDAHVRGLVVDDRSRPVRHASVRQVNGAAEALTSDDGTFTIVGLAPGTHRFRAENRARKSDTVVVEVESGRQPDPVRLVLRDGDSDTVVVRVETAERTPAAGALVFVETSAGETRIVTTGNDGRVAVAFDDGVPASVRCSAIHDGRWIFGDWRPSDTVREGLALQLGSTGELVVRSEEREGTLDVRAPYGWNLKMLLMRIGSVPVLSPDVPLRISGLPAGDYDVSIGNVATRATVRRGETATVTLRR